MARIRTIKPEFWKNEALSALPEPTHLLAAALLNYADDFGYFNANPKLIQAECSPLREPSVSIPESLRSLQTVRYVRLGSATGGKRYGQVVKFDEHQRVSHPTKSKIADLPITWEDSDGNPESLRNPQDSLRPEGNREQGTGKGMEGARESARDAGRHDPNRQEFLEVRKAYPQGTYRNTAWQQAERSYQKLIDDGTTHAELLEAAKAYAAQQKAAGNIGTQYVLSPAKFFADGDWRGPFQIAVTPEQRAADERATRERADWERIKAWALGLGCQLHPHEHDTTATFETRVNTWKAQGGARRQPAPLAISTLLAGSKAAV